MVCAVTNVLDTYIFLVLTFSWSTAWNHSTLLLWYSTNKDEEAPYNLL
jgi:hypothetical protein